MTATLQRPQPGRFAPRRPVLSRSAPNRPLLGSLGIIGLLALWEIAPRLGAVPERYFPPVSEVLTTLAQRATTAPFWEAIGHTLYGWALGLAIALAAAILIGFALGATPRLRAFTTSTVDFLRPIPSVALIPLAVLMYGTDIRSTLLLVVYACFWLIYIQVLYGVADVDPVAEQTARSYGLGRLARIRYVVWPTTLPYLMTGLRLAAAVGLILSITAQLIIGSPESGPRSPTPSRAAPSPWSTRGSSPPASSAWSSTSACAPWNGASCAGTRPSAGRSPYEPAHHRRTRRHR